MSRIFALVVAIAIVPFTIGCGGGENKVIEYDASAQAAIDAEEREADNQPERGEVEGPDNNDNP